MLKNLSNKLVFQLAVLFGTLALYLVTNALFGDPQNPYSFIPPLIGIVVLLELFIFVGLEIKEGAKSHGWKHEVLDTIIALAIAALIWFGASFFLNTDSPVSAVVSCSMLDNLQRGDFVIVQGAPIRAYEIEMTQDELNSLTGRSEIFFDGQNFSMDGAIFSYCLFEKADNRTSDICDVFVNKPENIREEKGAFTYHYGRCPISFSDGTSSYQPCVESVEFRGRKYLTNFSHDVVVYVPPPGDYFSYIGDIVHRAFFKIDVEGRTYYLTRGDNNPMLDLQVFYYPTSLGNHPIPEENLKGKVIARVPLLGYFKLFLSGYLSEDSQCRSQLEYTHVS